ncbi:hypothetical protein BSSX_1251 [Bacillus subtilis]|nr:hypothetical protein BSSX_1251 [Bacillus subtilis]
MEIPLKKISTTPAENIDVSPLFSRIKKQADRVSLFSSSSIH